MGAYVSVKKKLNVKRVLLKARPDSDSVDLLAREGATEGRDKRLKVETKTKAKYWDNWKEKELGSFRSQSRERET